MKMFTGRQITVMVVAVCAAVVAAPVAALAATGSFSSNTATVAAVSAGNSASGSGAKAVYGDASGSSGTEFGVYGHTGSARGYGVYSSGRLGSSGPLVCSHCVSGADIAVATLPTVPDATKLAGHASSYYARIVPLSWLHAPEGPGPSASVVHGLAQLDGLNVYGSCNPYGDTYSLATLSVAADNDADRGTINAFTVRSTVNDRLPPPTSDPEAFGSPLSTTPTVIGRSTAAEQVEGTATYRNDATGQVVTITFHVWGGGGSCEIFGNVLTAG